jgi:hypothetical protein
MTSAVAVQGGLLIARRGHFTTYTLNRFSVDAVETNGNVATRSLDAHMFDNGNGFPERTRFAKATGRRGSGPENRGNGTGINGTSDVADRFEMKVGAGEFENQWSDATSLECKVR